MTIGRAIQTFRVAQGIKQKDLAKELGISDSHLCLLEHGKRMPSAELLNAIQKGLNMEIYATVKLEKSTVRVSLDFGKQVR